jgi:hypothetical protein
MDLVKDVSCELDDDDEFDDERELSFRSTATTAVFNNHLNSLVLELSSPPSFLPSPMMAASFLAT